MKRYTQLDIRLLGEYTKEYVDADVAQELYDALKGVYDWFEGNTELDQQFIEAQEALKKADEE